MSGNFGHFGKECNHVNGAKFPVQEKKVNTAKTTLTEVQKENKYLEHRPENLETKTYSKGLREYNSHSSYNGIGMEKIKDGWFMETSSLWPGQAFCLKVEDILFQEKSEYQDVLVFKSLQHGNVLVLDGVIQCTEMDECSYQEMMTHLALTSHPNPKKVLVIGGGDGGVVREVIKHEEVESVTLCEIDQMVIDVSKKFLPYMSIGFSSPKLTVFVGDGFQFMKDHQNEFDVIITDSSDPEGPALALFQKEYFALMRSALKEDGLLCSQGEGVWIDLNVVVRMNKFCRELFPVVDYAYSSVPTYTSGVIGYCLCSKNPKTDFRHPLRKIDAEAFKLKYYNPHVHEAAFVLPEFARKALWSTKQERDVKMGLDNQ